MRIASFTVNERLGYGAVEGDAGNRTVVDVSRDPAFAGCRGLAAALSAFGVAGFCSAVEASRHRYALADVALEPVVTDADKYLCVGLNFRSHAEEAAQPIPERPALFLRSVSSFVGHEQAVLAPMISEQFDYEGELAVVIGRRGRHIPIETAMDWVLGYTCCAENSVRDWQGHSRQVTPGKNFHCSGALGPWCVTTDEAPDLASMTIRTRLNGQEVQRGDTGDFIFSIPELIAYVSLFAELRPGDVIATGTPPGVGAAQRPPLWLKPGDRLEVAIDGIGTLVNTVRADQSNGKDIAAS